MIDIINNDLYKGKYISIFLPTTIYNSNIGSLNMNKTDFDNVIKKMLRKYGKYDKVSEIYYEYCNKQYVVLNRRIRNIYKIKPIKVLLSDVLINIYEKNKLTLEEFPIIDKYHNIVKRNKMNFNYDNILISLITETHSSNITNYYVEISFINNNINLQNIKDIINCIKT